MSYRDEHERYDARPWQLFDLAEDFSETHDLAAEHPDKVRELDARWWEAARRYDVLPLVDLPLLERAFRTRRDDQAGRREFRLPRDITPMLAGYAPTLAGKSYTITATLPARTAADAGVLIAEGDPHSGYTLYVQDERLVYELNVGYTRTRIVADCALPAGNVNVAFRFTKVNTAGALVKGLLNSGDIDPWRTLGGTGTLLVDGRACGSAAIDTPLTAVWEGLEVGRDSISPVSTHYASPFAYSGRLDEVVIRID